MNIRELLQELGVRKISKSGQNYQMCCPFHEEERPSSGVMINYPYWFSCFTCGKKSNILGLIMHIKKCTPWCAKRLAKKYGYSKKDTGEVKKVVVISESILKNYKHTLPPWFLKRIKANTIEQWEIGYDITTKRVTIPIRDEQGKLRAISYGSNKEYPKYKFDFGSQKGKVLYGLHRNNTRDFLILVEGFLDVLKLWELGVPYAVAMMGNILTKDQEKLLIKSTNKVILALDTDAVGKVSSKLLEKRLKDKVALKVGCYPYGKKDPGEFDNKKQAKNLVINSERV